MSFCLSFLTLICLCFFGGHTAQQEDSPAKKILPRFPALTPEDYVKQVDTDPKTLEAGMRVQIYSSRAGAGMIGSQPAIDDTETIGDLSIAIGECAKARFDYAIALGRPAQSTTDCAIALGRETRSRQEDLAAESILPPVPTLTWQEYDKHVDSWAATLAETKNKPDEDQKKIFTQVTNALKSHLTPLIASLRDFRLRNQIQKDYFAALRPHDLSDEEAATKLIHHTLTWNYFSETHLLKVKSIFHNLLRKRNLPAPTDDFQVYRRLVKKWAQKIKKAPEARWVSITDEIAMQIKQRLAVLLCAQHELAEQIKEMGASSSHLPQEDALTRTITQIKKNLGLPLSPSQEFTEDREKMAEHLLAQSRGDTLSDGAQSIFVLLQEETLDGKPANHKTHHSLLARICHTDLLTVFHSIFLENERLLSHRNILTRPPAMPQDEEQTEGEEKAS